MEPAPQVAQASVQLWRRIHAGGVAALLLLSACAASSASAPTRAPSAVSAEAEHGGAAQCRPTDIAALRFGLVVLGSAGGPRSWGRAGSSYVVVVGGVPRVLIDVGPGTFLRLGEMEIDLQALDLVLLTHLHVDHSGDLPGFVLARAVAGNGPITFRIAGPAGAGLYPSTTDFVERLFGSQGAFAHVPTFTQNHVRFDVTELPTSMTADARVVVKDDGFSVSAISVDHADVPALAYRVEHGGHGLVVSGDLASKNDNLVKLAAGTDLLVYDTAVMDPPESTEALYELHTTPQRIGEVASQARVGSLLLSHVTGRVHDHAGEVMRSVQAGFNGEVRFAHDCMTIELDAH